MSKGFGFWKESPQAFCIHQYIVHYNVVDMTSRLCEHANNNNNNMIDMTLDSSSLTGSNGANGKGVGNPAII